MKKTHMPANNQQQTMANENLFTVIFEIQHSICYAVKREMSTRDGLYYYLMDCTNCVGEISESANYLTNLNIQKT